MFAAPCIVLLSKTFLVFYITFLVAAIIVSGYRFLIYKKIDFISIPLSIFTIIILLVNSPKFLVVLTFVLLVIGSITSNLLFLGHGYIEEIRKRQLVDHIKNDSCDFYLSMNRFNKVVDYSKSFQLLTKLSKKEILHKNGWNILLKNLNILKLNGEEFIITNEMIFKEHIMDRIDPYKMTEFSLDVMDSDTSKVNHYVGLIQGHFVKNQLVGSTVYLYQNKMALVDELKFKLSSACKNLLDYKNVINILMTLSEGVALYYDYQEKLYFATDAFMNFVSLDKQSYTFPELYEMIEQEDLEEYVAQSEKINSESVTRIKYRLNIKNQVFNVIEDSVYISLEDQQLVSILHITGYGNNEGNEDILSTKESVDLLAKLAGNPLSKLAKKTEDIIEKALRINDEDEQ